MFEKRIGISFFLFCFLTLPIFAQYRKKEVSIGKHHFSVDIAESSEEWRKGLMGREKMAPHEGMFFIGSVDKMQSFWMKNTLIPLDIIFIDKNLKIVHINENAEPLSENPRSSEKPARHILEISGGLSKRYGFKPGDDIVLSFKVK